MGRYTKLHVLKSRNGPGDCELKLMGGKSTSCNTEKFDLNSFTRSLVKGFWIEFVNFILFPLRDFAHIIEAKIDISELTTADRHFFCSHIESHSSLNLVSFVLKAPRKLLFVASLSSPSIFQE